METKSDIAKKELTLEETDILKELESILCSYDPDWIRIAKANQFQKNLAFDTYVKRTNNFCECMKELRDNYSLSLRAFGKLCNLSPTSIMNIEQKKINAIPYSKLEQIAQSFHISIAYLIGLADSPDYMPSLVEMYLWENPECKFVPYKELALNNLDYSGHRSMITVFSTPFEQLKDEMIEWMKNDIKLADIIHDLLSSPESKRCQYIKILDELRKI